MRIAVAGGTGTVGHHVVETARDAGHEAVILSRSEGVDVRTGDGLAQALTGVDVIIDALNAPSMDFDEAASFFTDAATNLQELGAAAGVRHVITLSIVGIDGTNFDYYRAKRAQEAAARGGDVPHTIMRATQFFEFAAQLISMTRAGGDTAHVFDVLVQPVAARTIADVLVEIAAGPPLGDAPDLAGPDRHRLVALAAEFVASRGSHIRIEPDTITLADLPEGGLLPPVTARIAGPRFHDWLSTPDAAALDL